MSANDPKRAGIRHVFLEFKSPFDTSISPGHRPETAVANSASGPDVITCQQRAGKRDRCLVPSQKSFACCLSVMTPPWWYVEYATASGSAANVASCVVCVFGYRLDSDPDDGSIIRRDAFVTQGSTELRRQRPLPLADFDDSAVRLDSEVIGGSLRVVNPAHRRPALELTLRMSDAEGQPRSELSAEFGPQPTEQVSVTPL